MPSIDLAAPSEAPSEASDDAILVPDITWPTYLAAIDWINQQGCLSGFSAVIKNSKKRRDGTLKTVYLRCDRGYNPPQGRDHPKRRSFTQATKCEWRAVIRLQPTGDWALYVEHHKHNHGPTLASAMPAQRRRQRERFISQIGTQISQGITPQQILTSLHQQGVSARVKDIYNLRQKLYLELLGGLTPIQALLLRLPTNGEWIFRYSVREDQTVFTLFAMHRTSDRSASAIVI